MSPRVLFVSSYRPAWPIMASVLGGAHVTCREPSAVVGRLVRYHAVVVLMPSGAPTELGERTREWARRLADAGTSSIVLCERDAMLWPRASTEVARAATRPDDGSPRMVQMTKPTRGAALRGMLSWTLGRAVTRHSSLDGPNEELTLCALHVAERHGLSQRDFTVVRAALEVREREQIAQRLGLTKRTVDEYAGRIGERAGMSLDSLVRRAWLGWMETVADDEGSGQFGAWPRKASGEVVRESEVVRAKALVR